MDIIDEKYLILRLYYKNNKIGNNKIIKILKKAKFDKKLRTKN